MPYKLAEAASTILKVIKGGKIHGATDEHEGRGELAAPRQTYPLAQRRGAGSDAARPEADRDPPDLEAEIEALIRQAGDRLRQQADDLHHDHDAERERATTRLLPDDTRERRPWWWRIIGFRLH